MRKFNKTLLLELAEELETNVSQPNRVREIRQAILNAEDYEEEAAKEYAARIWVAAEQRKAEETECATIIPRRHAERREKIYTSPFKG